MRYSDFTPAQVREVGRIIGGASAVKRLLARKLVVVPTEGWKPLRKSKLESNGCSSLVYWGHHIPSAYFKSGNGLHVGKSFYTTIIRAAAQAVLSGSTGKHVCMSRYYLKAQLSGRELMTLCPSAVFHATEFCPILARMLDLSAQGRGPLTNNARTKLFLVEAVFGRVYVAVVHWQPAQSGSGKWQLSTETLDRVWMPGGEFFGRHSL
ncbi:hypothetical protein HY413_00525 [Candidatus Kaiserbacteria bacterium]|nr:hypothetical protein [Candidatus Kaiserbacteria bacterium]